MIIRELLTRLGFDVDTKGGEKYNSVLRGIAVGAASAVAAVTAATGAIMGFAGAQADQIREIGLQAAVAGESFEKFQTSMAAANSVGFDGAKISDILKDTNDKVGDFLNTGGGELKDYFENIAPRVGQTAEQFRGLAGSDALKLYFQGLERANLSQAEMTFYLEAIANDATGLIPLLRNGGQEWNRLADEAEAYGVLTQEQLQTSLEFSAAMSRLTNIFRVMRQRIAVELMPALRLYIEQLLAWYRQNRALIEQNIVGALKAVLYAFNMLMTVVRAVGGWLGKLVGWVGGSERAIRLLTAAFGVLIAARVVRGIMALRTAILAMNVAAWANPFGLLVLAITAIIALIAGLILVGEDFIVWLQGGQSQFGEFYQYIADRLRDLGAWFAQTWDEISAGWDSFLTRLSDGWDLFATNVRTAWNDAIDFMESLLAGGFQGALDTVYNAFVNLIDRIRGLWRQMVDAVAGMIPNLMPSLPTWLTDLNPFGGPDSPDQPIDPGTVPGLVPVPVSPTGPRIPAPAPNGPQIDFRPAITINPTGQMNPEDSDGVARDLTARLRQELEDAFAGTLPNFPSAENM